jgi:hypothetical protein
MPFSLKESHHACERLLVAGSSLPNNVLALQGVCLDARRISSACTATTASGRGRAGLPGHLSPIRKMCVHFLRIHKRVVGGETESLLRFVNFNAEDWPGEQS